MKRTIIISALFSTLLATSAFADVVYLTNGRRLEGKIVKQDKRAVHILIPGGKLVLHRSMIDRMEDEGSVREVYAAELKKTDARDPVALDRLSLWAAANGLGKEARNLDAMARGIRLERAVAKAKGINTPKGYVDGYYWARGAGVSLESQRWFLSQAEGGKAKGSFLSDAKALHKKDLARVVERKRREAEALRRQRYLDPFAPKAAAMKEGNFRAVLSDPESRARLGRMARAKKLEEERRRARRRARKRKAKSKQRSTKKKKKKKTKKEPVYVDPGE